MPKPIPHQPLPGVHLLLKARRMRQRDIAEALGIDQSTMSLKISGKRPVSLAEALRLAEFLDCDIYDLLKEPGDLVQTKTRGTGK